MYDMSDHRVGQRIGWEAGGGCVRFRCRADVSKGDPLYNNYGGKGNQELLFTYGFAVRDNPLDAVEGIVVGCAADADAGLSAGRRRLLEEHHVPFTTRVTDGALLIGPFDLRRPLPTGADEAVSKEVVEVEAVDEEEKSFLPADLMYALQVIGMENVEEGPVLSLDELDLLLATLQARLGALAPAEGADTAAVEGTRAGFIGAYRDGQRRVLRAAIEEVRALMGDGADGEQDEL